MLLQSLIINVNINLLFWRSTVKNLPIYFNDGWPYSDPFTWVTMRILALQYCGWADDSSESIQYSEKSRPGPIYALNKTLNFLPFQSAWKRNTVIFFSFFVTMATLIELIIILNTLFWFPTVVSFVWIMKVDSSTV